MRQARHHAAPLSALENTRQAAHDAGCVEYFSKPIRAEALFGALQTHLGVRFVKNEEPAAPGELSDVEEAVSIARRVVAAVDLGDVTDLEALALQLKGGGERETALGERIARLTAQFDFDSLRDIAGALRGNEQPRGRD